jgi:hypothetical protein
MDEYAYLVTFITGPTRVVFPSVTHEAPHLLPDAFGVLLGQLAYRRLSAVECQQLQQQDRSDWIASIVGLMAKTRREVALAPATIMAANRTLAALLRQTSRELEAVSSAPAASPDRMGASAERAALYLPKDVKPRAVFPDSDC